jgi:hypothetical protein
VPEHQNDTKCLESQFQRDLSSKGLTFSSHKQMKNQPCGTGQYATITMQVMFEIFASVDDKHIPSTSIRSPTERSTSNADMI